MEALFPSSVLPKLPNSNRLFGFSLAGPLTLRSNVTHKEKRANLIQNRRQTAMIAAISDASLAADPTQVEITWQIVVGAIAGVTPFVVAGVEFSKRIMAQRRCKECEGAGLVLKDGNYFKCPDCGGFLPWQSWRRFFWG